MYVSDLWELEPEETSSLCRLSLLMAMDFVSWRGGEASCLQRASWLLGRSLSLLLPTKDGVRCSFSGQADGFPLTTQQTDQTPKNGTVAGLLEVAVGKKKICWFTYKPKGMACTGQ